ncbi:MAG: hypothetical protein IKU73_02325 [Clostridia bacterium]|nr:hypothetical protein [Clostridia bacterium]
MRNLSILLLFLLFALPAAAQEALFPALADPVDQYMQSLAVMSQQDESLARFPYHQENLETRGCAPLSIVNPLIAALGMTDLQAAAGLVQEGTAVLTPNREYRSRPVAVERIAHLLNRQDRAESVQDFPMLARYVGRYPGAIHVSDEDLSAETVRTLLGKEAGESPLIVGRMYVQDDWTQAVRIIYALYEDGYEDAFVFLGYAGAGTASTGAPLRSGESGHYLAVGVHVGTFVSNGSLYVLDSLPRALSGEDYGPDCMYHVPYRFIEDDSAFSRTFAASRISPTIIKLSLSGDELLRLTGLWQQHFPERGQKQEALIALQAQQLMPLKLFGRCMMIVSQQNVPQALAPTTAEDPYYPEVYSAVDIRMQNLAVLSQQDDMLEGIAYNNGALKGRGCAPLSIANGLAAAFGVTDPAQTKAITLEAGALLARSRRMDVYPVEANNMPQVLNPQLRMQERDTYPVLGSLIGGYDGQIAATDESLNAKEALSLLDSVSAPAIVSGRMYVNNGWENVVRILLELHARGQDDAMLILAYAGAGLDSSTAPLRSGASGHYLTVLLHVGSFIHSGAVYVLDSLPRALPGEPCGYKYLYRSAYAFPQAADEEPDDFNARYIALRISPTVIKLTLNSRELARLDQHDPSAYRLPEKAHEALVRLRARQLQPLMLYGSCVMMITLP